ncbi:MAG: Tm-1-like ATP-binding domain-containing protein [Janthinobacterium lividum]
MSTRTAATRPVVVLVGALDTKGAEYSFVADRLGLGGVGTLLVDTGVLGTPTLRADVDRDAVAAGAGTSIAALAAAGDRNAAMQAMAGSAATSVRDLVASGAAHGVLALGGSNAAYVMSRVAAELPIGVPKVLVSTIAAGDTRPYVGTSDLTLMYPVVDIAGLNSISRLILARAADACAGMVTGPPVPSGDAEQAVVACTMFGVTTTCVTAVRDALLREGREAHVFPGNGTGGRSLEAMIASGLFAAVADLTTTELADQLAGGVCSAGPERLTAAATHGVPQVVSVGAMDMVNFGAAETVPGRYADRQLLAYNPAVTLMRTSPAENRALGREIAEKLGRSTAFVEVHVPARGFSQISVGGAPFHDPEADDAMIASLREHLDPRIPLHVHDTDINDRGFALEISQALVRALDHPRGVPA